MRYQIQEMARVEKLVTDAEIQDELDIYNAMVPEPGQLCATLFLELTSDEQMRVWLPKLVGIEHAVVFVLPNGERVRSMVDEQHAAGLTRTEATAAVHYLRWEFTPEQVQSFAVRCGTDRDRSSRVPRGGRAARQHPRGAARRPPRVRLTATLCGRTISSGATGPGALDSARWTAGVVVHRVERARGAIVSIHQINPDASKWWDLGACRGLDRGDLLPRRRGRGAGGQERVRRLRRQADMPGSRAQLP